MLTCVWRIADFCGKSAIRHTQPGLASRTRVTRKWAIKLNRKHIEPNFNGLRTIHKSALLRCILPELAIRHTQVSHEKSSEKSECMPATLRPTEINHQTFQRFRSFW